MLAAGQALFYNNRWLRNSIRLCSFSPWLGSYMSLDRRDFHRQFATAVASLGIAGPLGNQLLAAETETMATQPLPIIDTHQHLWDLNRFQLPWLESAPEVLRRSYLPADYAQAIEGLNIVKSVYMEVDVAAEQQQAEADYVQELCAAGKVPTVGAVISGRPIQAEAFRKYIVPYKGSRVVKGVRQVLHPVATKRGLCLEPGFV
jgi:hypothetical protein